MSYATALESLRDLVVALSGIGDALVLLGYGDQGRPSAAHMTLRMVNDRAVGWSARTSSVQVSQERQARIQIDAYRASAVTGLRQLAALLQSGDARVLAATGMAIQGVGDVRDTTAIWMTTYEPRATLEVLMGYAAVYTAQDPASATSIGLVVNADVQGTAAYDEAPGYDVGTYTKTLTIEIADAAPIP